MVKTVARNQVRIIAGKWRGRKISFAPIDNLRPTPDRVRETLFNWLQFDIVGKNCLDLCAGSGALGLESLSRGAANLTLVETHTMAIEELKNNLTSLKAENFELEAQDVTTFLARKCPHNYDIIFLDPPYKMHLLNQCIDLIEQNQWLAFKGYLYFEQAKQDPDIVLSQSWVISHKKTTGNISYYLARFCAA